MKIITGLAVLLMICASVASAYISEEGRLDEPVKVQVQY